MHAIAEAVRSHVVGGTSPNEITAEALARMCEHSDDELLVPAARAWRLVRDEFRDERVEGVGDAA